LSKVLIHLLSWLLLIAAFFQPLLGHPYRGYAALVVAVALLHLRTIILEARK
jgi:hypothetical protein